MSQGLAAYTVVPVDECCRVDPAAVEAAITPSTVLVTIMHSNNEVGVHKSGVLEEAAGEGAETAFYVPTIALIIQPTRF